MRRSSANFAADATALPPVKLQAHYDAMRASAAERLMRGQAEVDALLDDPADTRRGLTLLARLPATLAEALAPVLTDFRRLEPAQYYYPAPDLHLTVLSLISCVSGFRLADVEPAAYRALVADVLRGFGPFNIVFRGLTASAGAVLLQGFPADDTLGRLREALRTAFRAAGLRQSIDQRYSIQTAHSTLLRYRVPLRDVAGVLALLGRYERQPFGTVRVAQLELVYNDWYQRAAHTTLLERYAL